MNNPETDGAGTEAPSANPTPAPPDAQPFTPGSERVWAISPVQPQHVDALTMAAGLVALAGPSLFPRLAPELTLIAEGLASAAGPQPAHGNALRTVAGTLALDAPALLPKATPYLAVVNDLFKLLGW